MQPDQYFTPASILGLGAATVAVNAVATTLWRVSNLSPVWTAFITAQLIAYVIVGMKTNPWWYEWVLAFLNGCLLFCSASGVNELGARKSGAEGKAGRGGRKEHGIADPRRRRLFESWFK